MHSKDISGYSKRKDHRNTESGLLKGHGGDQRFLPILLFYVKK